VVAIVTMLGLGQGAAVVRAQCPGDCPVPGGGTSSVDCLVEYFGLAQSEDLQGRISCQDGDAACDHDATENGQCAFDVRVCLNQTDPLLPACTASGVESFNISRAAGDSELAALQSSVRALLPSSSPGCTGTQRITVPLGGTTEAPLAGRRFIRSVAGGANGKDADRILLSCNPPPRPLGRRRFSINPANSPLYAVLGTLSLPAGQFRGYLDLEAGIPDDDGIAQIDVVGSSDYIYADLRPNTPQLICLKPVLPSVGAGIVACKGRVDISYLARVDHIAGVVGVNDFTEEQCTALTGTTGNGQVEGPEDAHPDVCNGPLFIGGGGRGDSGRGAVALTPDPDTGEGGLRFELSFVKPGFCRSDDNQPCTGDGDCTGENDKCMQACGDGSPGQNTPLPFFSGPVRVEIEDADGTEGTNRVYDTKGQNFSCANWTKENGPGKLIFGFAQLHGFSLGGPPLDLITAFILTDK
jgi:hypothetical protein